MAISPSTERRYAWPFGAQAGHPQGLAMNTSACRLCGDRLTRVFIDLGAMPFSHRIVMADAGPKREHRAHPVFVWVCDRCLLVQLDAGPDQSGPPVPELPYHHASAPAANARHGTSMIERFGLGPGSLVMEIASTDGCRLRPFRDAGIPVLGIEPASHLAEAAHASGIPTEQAALNAETAMAIAVRHGRADFVAAHGVLAEVSDLFGFAAGFAGILRPNGIVAFEFPHLLSLMERTRFDHIDHAHRSYLTLLVAERLLRSVGLVVFDLECLPPPGNALRLFACHARGPYTARPSVKSMRLREVAAKLDQPGGYDTFAPKAVAAMRTVRTFIDSRRRSGRRFAAHGVTAEANTLLNACGITHRDILCVADPDPARRTMLLPGSNIPVVSPDALVACQPDDVLIFPPDGPMDAAIALAARLPGGTCFWSLGPTPHALAFQSEAT